MVMAQAHAILRQRYMTGGEALINQWHDRIINGQANSTLTAKSPSLPTFPTHSVAHAAAEGDGARFWSAVRGLVDVNTQVALSHSQHCLAHSADHSYCSPDERHIV